MIKKVVQSPLLCARIERVVNMDRRGMICDALAYIDGHFENRLVLNELAERAGYSVPQFSRLFTEYCGITPMRYVKVVRIHEAARLASDTDRSITEIAFRCGFDTLEAFERGFKRYFHVSPADWRRHGCRPALTPFYLSEKIYYERLRSGMLIDGGNPFDWGRTARQYAAARNIYPDDFFETLHSLGVGGTGQRILDIGTGTGILPFNMAKYGGEYTGVDLSEKMIEQAKIMCDGMSGTNFIAADAHCLPFEDNCFSAVTALQCWVYFDKKKLVPELMRVLKSGGELYVMFMTWLPEEDEIIRKSFSLVHKYNPAWSGYMKRTGRIDFPWAKGAFRMEAVIKKDYLLPFSRESWCDRMTASRGVGASLPDEKIARFREELMAMLKENAEENFSVPHEAVIIKLRKEKENEQPILRGMRNC